MKRIEIPRSFMLANASWTVRLVTQRTLHAVQRRLGETTVEDLDGYCAAQENRIYLCKTLARRALEEVWLHELDHAIEIVRGVVSGGAESVVGPRARHRAQVYQTSKGSH